MNDVASRYCYNDSEARTFVDAAHLPWLFMPLFWLLRYCLGLGVGNPAPPSPACQHANRYDRKISQRTVSQVRDLSPFEILLPRGLSPTQYLERMSRISIFGRRSLYNICVWGSVLRRRALLICYDHGWWRTPIGPMGLLYCGVWRVHLWPN